MTGDLNEIFNLFYLILIRGGWVGFVVALVYMFYKIYMDYIQINWYYKQDWVFLKITSPKENEKSPLAFEQIFNQLHSIHDSITWAQKHIEGQFQIWFTWEIVSIGGTITNQVKILKKHRHTLEAAVYSQFPEAEITETEDYLEKLPAYHTDTSEYDIFAFTFRLIREDAYPIKTYYDFEHASADTFVDPIAGMWEELGQINSYEMFIIQFVLRPIDNDWKEEGYELVQKLKGVPESRRGGHGNFLASFLGTIFGPLLDAIFIRSDSEGTHTRQMEEPPSLMLHLSEGEKEVIAAVERNLSKWGYQTKIHCLYVAPREKYNPIVISRSVIGAFKSYGSANLNALKPYTEKWTKVNYLVFENLEKPIVDLRLNWRKREYMKLIRRRFYFWGPPPDVLNTEELASILHFPQTTVAVPPIEKVTVVKVQPPAELPIAE